MMKQRILKWLKNLEAQSKNIKKKLQEPKKKKSSDKFFNYNRRIAKIDDGILSATIETHNKDVIITIKGFNTIAKATDWATLQSILWKSDQESRVQLTKDLNPNTVH